MNGPGRMHPWIQLDFSEGVFVLDDILLQDGEQRLGLLRTNVDSLKITDFDLVLALLLKGSKYQEEVPDVHSYLDAVGVVFAIVGCIS